MVGGWGGGYDGGQGDMRRMGGVAGRRSRDEGPPRLSALIQSRLLRAFYLTSLTPLVSLCVRIPAPPAIIVIFVS